MGIQILSQILNLRKLTFKAFLTLLELLGLECVYFFNWVNLIDLLHLRCAGHVVLILIAILDFRYELLSTLASLLDEVEKLVLLSRLSLAGFHLDITTSGHLALSCLHYGPILKCLLIVPRLHIVLISKVRRSLGRFRILSHSSGLLEHTTSTINHIHGIFDPITLIRLDFTVSQIILPKREIVLKPLTLVTLLKICVSERLYMHLVLGTSIPSPRLPVLIFHFVCS